MNIIDLSLPCFISIVRDYFFFFYKILMSVKLVKGYSSVLSLLHICVFVVALSSSLLFLNWRVLSFESTCDFHIFFLVPLHDFHVLYVCKRERKIVCVCLLSSICTIALCSFLCAMCSYSFYRWKNDKQREGEKKMQKRHIEYLLIFYFSFLFLFEISFVVLVFFDRK
jgi:magnesium-transporting ATPase (P-type)